MSDLMIHLQSEHDVSIIEPEQLQQNIIMEMQNGVFDFGDVEMSIDTPLLEESLPSM